MIADEAVGQQPLDLPEFGQEMIIVHHGHLQAGRVSRARQISGDGGHIADGLLAEHVQAGGEGVQYNLRAMLLRHGDDHRFDRVEGEQVAVIGVELLVAQAEPLPADGAARGRDIGERDQFDIGQGQQRRTMPVINDIAAADKTDL